MRGREKNHGLLKTEPSGLSGCDICNTVINRVDSADLAIYTDVPFLPHCSMGGSTEAAEYWVKKNELPGV